MANINQNRWDQLVRRVAGLIGPGSKVNNTIGDLFPMLDVENLPGELYLLSGTRLGFGGAAQVGSAGESARVQLFNPADSGMLVTITGVMAALSSGTGEVAWVLRNVAESTNTFATVRDTRLGIITRTTALVLAASDPVVLSGDGRIRLLVNTPLLLNDPNGVAVLAPGTGLTVFLPTVAQVLFCNFWWRERAAEQAELQF